MVASRRVLSRKPRWAMLGKRDPSDNGVVPAFWRLERLRRKG
jgi:hypothetical protein